MKEKNCVIGHLACFVAYAIFGLNIVVCKDITSNHLLSPFALFALRSIGAGALFWLLSLFLPNEKVEKKDYPRILLASILGFFLTQVSFLMAISDITPMDCSIVSALSPVYTMFIAAIALKEPITWEKAGGVVVSFCGIVYLILNSVSSANGVTQTKPVGVALILVNSICFSLYLGIFKPLISKYSVVTFMKWIFLFSTLVSFPVAGKEIIHQQWLELPTNYMLEVGFLIIGATFITYFLIPVGQKRIRPTLVSMYSYVQPIVAITISIVIGMDTLSWQKVVAAATVLGGVVLVNNSKSADKIQYKS